MSELLQKVGTATKRWMIRSRVRSLSRSAWRARHDQVFAHNPEYRRPAPKGVESQHLAMWRPVRPDISLDTLRVCYNISGVAVPEMVPEELYASEVEQVLNRDSMCRFLSHKSAYNRWFRDMPFPTVYLHQVDGVLLSSEYEVITREQADGILAGIEYPVVFKLSRSAGGRGVVFCRDRNELSEHTGTAKDFVVQAKVRPHPFFLKFNDYGLNTLRVCTYRSFSDGDVHVLNAAMRIGRAGGLDNETQGGIVRFVREDGTLNTYGVDKYGQKFTRHPDSGIDLTVPEPIPQFEEMKALAVEGARLALMSRLASFDMCLDADGRWRFIELNLASQTIRFAQYAGRPFFGEFTAEVIEQCRTNPQWRL
jgi:hypothetical protein